MKNFEENNSKFPKIFHPNFAKPHPRKGNFQNPEKNFKIIKLFIAEIVY